MDQRLITLALRAVAGGLALLGLVAVLIGYLGVRNEADVALQLPYLASGGLGGLALLGLGALVLIQSQMREQEQRFLQVTEQLEDWKESALDEIRSFLEGAEIEVEVTEPRPVAPIRRRAKAAG